MGSNRTATVRKIDDILDGQCKTCEVRAEFNKKYGSRSAHLDKHCKSSCPVGLQLVELGQELMGTVRPRKQIKLEVEEVMAKTKFNMSAEEYFAERQAGKSIAQIAKEQDVSEATIYNHMNKWAEVGKVSGSVEDSPELLREKDTVPATELEQLEKAVQEIERLTAEVERWKSQAENVSAQAERSNDSLSEQLRNAEMECDVLQAEINRMISERDELVSEIDELHREKTGWTENERILNHLVEQLRSDLQKRQAEPQLADKPSEVQLLDRSIADLTRARWILNRLTASGE